MRPRYSVRRKVVKRNIIEGWNILKADHFDHEKVYPDAYFRRRSAILMFFRDTNADIVHDFGLFLILLWFLYGGCVQVQDIPKVI